MDKKYVLQAFDANLKGRFEVLYKYYGNRLFALPAIIVVAQIKDELGIEINEQSIYTLKKRIKGARNPVVSNVMDHMLPVAVPFQALGPQQPIENLVQDNQVDHTIQ